MSDLFRGAGGYRWLDSYVMGTLIQLGTHRFCEKFVQEGGFREQLKEVRTEELSRREGSPQCPECGEPMRKRTAKSGKNQGKPFWGCSGYPKCNGVREVET